MPIRRGTFIVPGEVGWIIKRYATDTTSASLRRTDPTSGSLQGRSGSLQGRRGTPVVPAETRWIIQRCASDATSASLQADLTSRSLRTTRRANPRSTSSQSRQGQATYPQTWGRHISAHTRRMNELSRLDALALGTGQFIHFHS
jgi:hypothetical protein